MFETVVIFYDRCCCPQKWYWFRWGWFLVTWWKATFIRWAVASPPSFGHLCKGFRSLSGLTWLWRGLGKLTSSFFCNLGDGDVKVKSMWVDVSSRVVRTTDPPVNRRVWRFSCRLPQWKSRSMLADYAKPWRSLQPALNGSFATKLYKWLLTTYCTLTFAIYTWYIYFKVITQYIPAIYSNLVLSNSKIFVGKECVSSASIQYWTVRNFPTKAS